jgi:hypothetical protein
MRQSFLAISIFIVLTGCATPVPTPGAPTAQPVAQTTPLLNNPTVAPSIVEATQPSNNPTLVPSTVEGTQPPTLQPTTPPTSVPTATPIPSPTPVPAQLVQLMDGTCCASPGWYSDSETILFIDKPNPDAATGIYSVNINSPSTSALWSERIAFYTREFDYAQIPEQAGTRLIRVSDGKEIRVRNGGRQVSFSPDRTRGVVGNARNLSVGKSRLEHYARAH